MMNLQAAPEIPRHAFRLGGAERAEGRLSDEHLLGTALARPTC